VRDNFANLKNIVEKNSFSPVNAILMDLGWSTPQFEERGRGFSFLTDEVLDMRYDSGEMLKSEGESLTAAEVVNSYSENELAVIFKNLGEEQLSREIAKAITVYRKNKKIEKTGELTEIILQAYREKLKSQKEIPWIGGFHPATKVFQALRIEVNHELENLKAYRRQ
jgi:16S rRNA (cytosine1402-N4)-methyltransferase